MKFISTLVALVLVCVPLAACNKSGGEKVLTKESSGSDTEKTGEGHRKLPECAQRNPDGTYKYGHACTADEWNEWQKTQQSKE